MASVLFFKSYPFLVAQLSVRLQVLEEFKQQQHMFPSGHKTKIENNTDICCGSLSSSEGKALCLSKGNSEEQSELTSQV